MTWKELTVCRCVGPFYLISRLPTTALSESARILELQKERDLGVFSTFAQW